MQDIVQHLEQLFAAAIEKAFSVDGNQYVEVTLSTNPKFGHFQINSAMRLAKKVSKNPREVATSVLENLEDNKVIASCEIAGPGFINITVSNEVLEARLQKMLTSPRFGLDVAGNSKQKVVVDFSSPNIAKEMHVGHLRSTIIGESIARLFEYLDYDVLRLNHVGDWGTAFGMLIVYMMEHAKDVLEGRQDATLEELKVWYKAAKVEFDANEEFKKASQQQVVKLQAGDEYSIKAWQVICELSRKAFNEIYALLDVTSVERGESFYNPYLGEVCSELEDKKLAVISDGALCIFNEGFTNREGNPLPFMIRKSDGGFNYATTDLAAMHHRVREEKADRIIIVTDSGQSEHFKMLEQSARSCNYLTDKVRFDHVPFGLVLGEDKKKFKTRSGETERLIDLLDAAVKKAASLIDERETDLNASEKQELAKTLGIGAVKYADLANNRVADYVFSYNKMLQFEGNTITYLMYSYVRVNGIKRKLNISDTDIENLIKSKKIELTDAAEIDLALHLEKFARILNKYLDDLLPHRLTEYLFELANKFNVFFRDCRVQGADNESSRLILCELVARVMRDGLHILGTKVVDRM